MNDRPDIKKRPWGAAYLSPGWPSGFVPNGIATYVANAYEALRAAGMPVYVFSTKTRFGSWSRDVRTFSGQDPQKRLAAIAEQVKKLKDEKKIGIFEMGEVFGWAHSMARSIPVPLIVKLHGPWFLNGKANGVREDERFAKRVADELKGMQSAAGVTAPSRDVLKRTQAYYGCEFKRSRVIPNPVKIVPEANKWHLSGCDKKKILFVGRFDRHKGADILIEAFASIVKKFPASELLFVGADTGLEKDGKYWGIREYVRRVVPVPHQGKVRWLGPLSAGAIEKLRRKAFMTIIPSRYENFANTLLESMVYGCPTLASRVGGNPEILEEGRDGLLFENENPEDLADKALQLLGNEGLAEKIGRQAAGSMAAKYHPEKIASQMMDYYAEIAGQPK